MPDFDVLKQGSFEHARDEVARAAETDVDSGVIALVFALSGDRETKRRSDTAAGDSGGRLFTRLCGSHPEVRSRAAAQLYLLGEAGVRSELRAAIQSKENLVRYHATRALASLVEPGEDAATVALLVELTADPVLMVRRAAVHGLGPCGGSHLTPILLPFLADRSENLRRNAADALAVSGDLRALVPLIESLADRDWHVRRAAALAIAALAKRHPGIEVRRAIPALRKGLGGWPDRRLGIREACQAAIDAIEAGSADVAEAPIPGSGCRPDGSLPLPHHLP